MSQRRVAIVGAGRMGQGIGLALLRAGWEPTLLARTPRPLAGPLPLETADWERAIRAARLVLLATPDDAVTEVAEALARLGGGRAVGAGHVVLHLSGVLDRRALAALEGSGAALGSFHPLQTVADPRSAPERLRGAFGALEGDPRALEAGRALAAALGMEPVPLAPGGKPLYHAGAVLAANYVVALAGVAERLAWEAGVPAERAGRIYLPLLAGAVENVTRLGPAEALTGPVRRGDLSTLRAHLAALAPRDRTLYRALGRAALDLAREAGLPEPAARAVAALLEEEAMGSDARRTVSGGAGWEAKVGYSRAVRVGPHVYVAGTTAALPEGGALGGGDAYAQTKEVLRRIEAALAEAGARLEHVVRTRIFVTDIARWPEVGRAHGEVFGTIRPAATLVEVRRLIAPDLLVEIEAEAYLPG